MSRARELGVQVFPFCPRAVRVVTHLDVSTEACAKAGDLLLDAIERAD